MHWPGAITSYLKLANFAQYLLLAAWVKPYPHGLGEGWETMQEGVHHLAWCLHTHTHKGGIELRACNSQPSEPFIYWGLKSYRSTFNDISLCKKKKKSTHPEKKHKKHSSPSKKSEPQNKSTKKHYGAFKSTHYDPWAGAIIGTNTVPGVAAQGSSTIYAINLY